MLLSVAKHSCKFDGQSCWKKTPPPTVNSFVKVGRFFSHILTNGTLGLTITDILFNAGASSTRTAIPTISGTCMAVWPGGRRTSIERNIYNSQAKRSVSKDMAEEPFDFHETIDSTWEVGYFSSKIAHRTCNCVLPPKGASTFIILCNVASTHSTAALYVSTIQKRHAAGEFIGTLLPCCCRCYPPRQYHCLSHWRYPRDNICAAKAEVAVGRSKSRAASRA